MKCRDDTSHGKEHGDERTDDLFTADTLEILVGWLLSMKIEYLKTQVFYRALLLTIELECLA